MSDGLIPLPGSRFRVRSADPAFVVQWKGGSRFELTGEVSLDPNAALEVDTPSDSIEVLLERRSRPSHAVRLLQRDLPRDVVLTHAVTDDGVEVAFHEALVPAATPPRLRLFSTDTAQRILQLDENKVELVGATARAGLLTILCDRKRVTIALGPGSSAYATAAKVGASMPHGYRALVDGAVVSVWKDADFFSMVA